ncbi:MAG TPA: TatD family hydrolase [Pirellulaceae bacterium]|nr:TatD family hydrolase [Pirellulaceae bacterium]
MWFDTHAHLDDEQLAAQVDDVVSRAATAGVGMMLAVGTTRASSEACVALADRFPDISAAVGIHPNYAHQASDEDWRRIEVLADDERVAAIGETGLDRYWDHCPFELQLVAFRRQIALAVRTARPFIVHLRDCEEEMRDELRRAADEHGAPLAGILHSFCGGAETAELALSLGLHLSFAGMLTYPKNQALRELAATVPLERLLLETDCPYLSPHPHRSRRPNEPELMVHTARCLAEARGMTLRDLAAATTGNAIRLFGRRAPRSAAASGAAEPNERPSTPE